jgi:hypothetical protein
VFDGRFHLSGSKTPRPHLTDRRHSIAVQRGRTRKNGLRGNRPACKQAPWDLARYSPTDATKADRWDFLLHAEVVNLVAFGHRPCLGARIDLPRRLPLQRARSFAASNSSNMQGNSSLADETTAALFKAADIGAPGVPNRKDSNGIWPRDVLTGCAEQGATQPTPHEPIPPIVPVSLRRGDD